MQGSREHRVPVQHMLPIGGTEGEPVSHALHATLGGTDHKVNCSEMAAADGAQACGGGVQRRAAPLPVCRHRGACGQLRPGR